MNINSGRLAVRMATVTAIGALLASTDLGWGRGIPGKQAPVVVTGASGKAASCGSAGGSGGSGSGASSSNSASVQFSGQATVISLTNSTQPPLIIIGDTGQLPSIGGDIEVSVTETNMEGLSVELGHASTIGAGDTASSSVSLSNLRISFHTSSGVRRTITADTILINVSAISASNGIVFTAGSDIEGLAVDGTSVTVTGDANQLVDFGDFSLIINAEVTNTTAQSGTIVLAALHIIDADLLEGFVGLARSDIQSSAGNAGGGGGGSGTGGNGGDGGGGTQPPPSGECEDFVTGGGWIVGAGGAKANFGVGGGIRHGAFWGHLNFIDHATGMHVKATAVTGYDVTAELTRLIHFDVTIDGQAGTALVEVTDNGEPGRNDTFQISLSTGYSAGGSLGGDRPGGGNIQLHKAKCAKGNGDQEHGGNGGGGAGNGDNGGNGGDHNCNNNDQGDHQGNNNGSGNCESKPAPTGKGKGKSSTPNNGNGNSNAGKGNDSGKGGGTNCDPVAKPSGKTVLLKGKGKSH